MDVPPWPWNEATLTNSSRKIFGDESVVRGGGDINRGSEIAISVRTKIEISDHGFRGSSLPGLYYGVLVWDGDSTRGP